MPTNKNAQVRYQVLDRCFSDFQRKYTINDLIDEVNETLNDLFGSEVSLRQIREDIKYMRDRVTFDAPIKAYQLDGKKCYYRYEDKDYSIFKKELSSEELVNLRSTIEMLGRYRGIPSNAWLEEVISNLEYRFGVKGNSENFISFEQNEQLKGLEHLSSLIDATVNHQPLLLEYQSFKGKVTTSVIHPYHIKQFNNRWFVLGLEEHHNGNRITNRALDRIVKFSFSDVPFIPNDDIDFRTYFDDVIGVTIPDEGDVEDIVLRFSPSRFPYVVSKPIHHSQKVINETDCTLKISVMPNLELEARIFFFGADVEVLQPQWFREKIAEKIRDEYKKYFDVQNDCT